ncbi:protein phosphatase, partial [Streptomyces bomunensis]|nr:protein phosphatase [Streptomyces montanisoli]
MAHEHQRDSGPSPCPNPECGEPVERGDLFCGACGYDLTAVPPREAGTDVPTVALSVPGTEGATMTARPDAAPGAAPGGLPHGARAAVRHPGELPGEGG